MSNLIVESKDINVSSDIIYGNIRIGGKGGKSIYITNKNTRKPLMIHCPMLKTYGVNCQTHDDSSTSYDMTLQFPRSDFENEETKSLIQMFQDMEDKILKDAFENSRDWFGGKKSMDVIKEFGHLF